MFILFFNFYLGITAELNEVIRNNTEVFLCSSPLGRTISSGNDVKNNKRGTLKRGQRKVSGPGPRTGGTVWCW